jgi:tape measure domain-containing protein
MQHMAASLGEAFINVKASTKGFAAELGKQLRIALVDAQKQADGAFANIANGAKAASRSVTASAQAAAQAQANAAREAARVATQLDRERLERLRAFGRQAVAAQKAADRERIASNRAAERAMAAASRERLQAFAAAARRAVAEQKAADRERAASARAAEREIARAARERDAALRAFGRAAVAAQRQADRERAASARAAERDIARTAREIERALAEAARVAARAARIADQERVASARRAEREIAAAARAQAAAQVAAARAAAQAQRELAAAYSTAGGIAQSVGGVASSAFNNIATAAKFATVGVLALGAAMTGIGLQQAGQIQLAETAFSSLATEIENGQERVEEYTDAQRAAVGKEFVESLQNIALNSSLAFSTLSRTSQQLLSLGFAGDEAKAVVLTVGDALAASGKAGGELNEDLRGVITAFAQIEGSGRLLAQDLNQITTRIPSATRVKVYNNLARDLGLASKAAKEGSPELTKARKEIIKLAEAGQIDSSLAIKSITEALRDVPGAAGALDRVNKTLPGQIEELKETIRLRLGQAFTDITPQLADRLGEIGTVLGAKLIEIGPTLQEFALNFVAFLEQAIPPALDAIGKAFQFVNQAFQVIGPFIPPLIAAFGALFSVASAVVGAIGSIISTFQGLESGTQTVIAATAGFVATFGALILIGVKVVSLIKTIRTAMIALNVVLLANPVILVVAAIAALAAAFVIAWQRSERFREIVVGVLGAIANSAAAVIDKVLGLLQKLVDGFAAVANNIPFVGGAIGGAFDKASLAIQGARDAAIGVAAAVNAIPTSKTIDITVRTTTDASGNTRPEGFIGPIIPNNPAEIARLQAAKAAEKQERDLAALLERLGNKSAQERAGAEQKEESAAERAAKAAAERAKARAEAFAQAIRDLKASLDAEFKQGLVEGTAKQIDKTLDGLRKKITQIFRTAGKKLPSNLLKSIEEDNKALKRFANERDRVLERLAAATSRANEVTNSILGFANAVSESAAAIRTAAVDLSRLRIILPGQDALFGDGKTKQQRDAEDFAKSLKDRLKAIKDFQANIQRLIRAGLNKETIDQIISGGVEDGGLLAQTLAAASKETIKSINESQAAIGNAAEKLGNTAADSLFRSGKNVVAGLIAGLEERRDEIKDAMKRIADDLVGEIKKQLKERSPSRVMRDRGRNAGKGLELGLLDEIPAVRAAGEAMALATMPSFQQISLPSLQAMAARESAISPISGLVGGSAANAATTAQVTNTRQINAPITQNINLAPGMDALAIADVFSRSVAGRLR